MLNVVAITGRLTADPELKKTNTGTSVCSFTVAVDRNFVKQGEERQADFLEVVAWKNAAEFVSKYFQKGSMIAVQGTIQTRNWEDKNGNKRKSTEIIADQISFCGGKAEEKPAKPNIEYEVPPEMYEVPDDDEKLPF